MDLAYFFALQKKSPSPWISNWNKHSTNWRRIGVKFFYYIFYDTNKKSTTLTGSNYSMIFFVFVAKTEKKVGGKFRLPFFFSFEWSWRVARAKTQTNAWIEFFGQIDDVVNFFVLYFTTQTKKSLYWWSMRCSKRLSSMLDKLMTHWHQFFVIFYDVNKKSPNHSDALLVQSILT